MTALPMRVGRPVGPTGVLVSRATRGPAWHRARAAGIGGSDASAVLGLNPWRSAFEVWAEKVGPLVGSDDPPSEAAHFGHVLESVVAVEWAERQRLGDRQPYRLMRCPGVVAHRENTWLRCTVDRLVLGEFDVEPVALLECKTAGPGTSAEWTLDEPAGHALVQVQHCLAATGWRRAFIAVLINGHDFRHYVVERDDAFVALMLDHEREFWEHVQARREPPVVDVRAEPALRRLYRDPVPASRTELPAAVLADVETYRAARERRAAAQAEMDDARTRVEAHLRDTEDGEYDGRLVCSWRASDRDALDVALLRANEPEIADKYTTRTRVRTFRLH